MKPVLNNHFYALLNSEEAVLYSKTACRKFKKAKSIVFIDSNVSDCQSLIAGAKPDIEVVILDYNLDGVEQITKSLQAGQYNSVHIVSHGSPGCLYLGKSPLCLNTLDTYANQLQQWFEKQESNELLLYGCNVAAGDAGEEFITKLHQLTAANIGASANRTGSAFLGADWNLEITVGAITPVLAFKPEVLESYSFAFPSANDDFANRIILSGVSGTSSGNNVGATAETGEATQSGTNNSIWWSWTAPSSGTVTFDTIGSGFDTYLSVYTGSSVNALSTIAYNDDIGGGNTASRVSFTVTAGTTYHIAVDGFSSNTGNVTLNYSFNNNGTTTTGNSAPTLADTVVTLNSVNRDAALPSGAVGTLVSSLVGIGRNVTDSNTGAVTGIAITSADSTNGTWYYSTNNGTSWNTLGTVSSTNARLLAADSNTRVYFRPNAGYTGSVGNAITFRAWDQTSGVTSGVADTSINGGSTAFSTTTDTASITVSNSTPINDNFANQITLTQTSGNVIGTNVGATVETGEATQSGTINSVWWSWTAPTSGTVTFDTIGSNFDTYLSVYTGTTVNSLTLVTFDDDGGGANTSRVSFAVIAGTTYRIAVDGYNSNTGNISLNYSLNSGGTTTTGNLAPTLTDTVVTLNSVNRDAALPSGAVGTLVSSLVGIGRNVTDSNTGAVTGIAITGANTTNGIWYVSTNNGSTWNTLGTVSSTSARLLAADTNTRVYFRPNAGYTGSISNAITFRAWDQTSGVASGVADTSVNGGSTAFSTATDTASITVSNPAPINDNFANQITLAGTSGNVTGTNVGATAEIGEATQSGTNNSVWWSWTAPSSGTVTFDTIGSNFDTYLSVYTGTSVNSLTLVTFDDQSGGANTSRVSFAVTAGTTYRIAVDGYQASIGNISLNYSLNSGGTTTTGNLAPTLIDTVVTLNSVNRDAALPSGAVGTLVSSLVGIGRNVTDSNTGAVTGIAITGADTTNGIWYVSINNGTTWNTLGTVSSTSARLLAADTNTRVYFRPNAGYTGSISNAITFRAWDQTSGVAGSFADTTINGGSTAFSNAIDTASIIVNSPSPINDNFASRTVISGTSGKSIGTNISATGEAGELTQSGTTNSVWWSWTAPSNGTVTFDTIGSNFDTFLSVYTGNSINNLSLIRSDDNTGGNNASWTSLTVTAGTTYQIAVDGFESNTGNIVLNYVLSSSGNRPPILTDTVVTLDAISQNAGTPSGAVGTLVSSLVALGRNVTDLDSGARTGIAITNANTTNGSWWYSINNGENWFALDDVYSDLARVLAADANTRIYFQPNANFTGTISNAISFRAWDARFSGDNGFRIAAANFTEVLSNFTDTASITVNTSTSTSGSAPVLTDTVVTLNSINEDAGAPNGAVGTLVSSIVGLGRNVTDSRSGAVTGIAITSVSTSNGTWWYSTNNGASWLQMGTLSNSNARLLAADTNTRIYFQANTNYNGSISNAITFRAWNQTSGVNGSIANTTLNGGSTAFSSLADTASINVNAVNDAPVISASYPLGIPTNATNGRIIGSLTATDIDSSNTVFSNWTIASGNIDVDGDGNMAFRINPNTGQIAINDIDDLNPQVNPTVNLQVNVSDGLAISANENVVIKLALRPGDLDPNFGISGIVTTPNTAYSRGVAVQPDGKIVVAGGFGSFDVARYNIDGTLDTSFGNSGRVNTDIGPGGETGYSVTLGSDNKIIVAGYVWDSTQPNYPDFALARYNVDGSLDTTFGNGGKVITNFGEDFGRNVLVQSDGKVILAGYIGNGNADYVLVRYNANGSLDTTFGSSGKVNGTNGHVAALQSDGKILVGGRVQVSSAAEFDFSLARYNSDGSLDTSFGNGGRSIVSIGIGEEIDSIAIQADGKIVVAGNVWRYVGGSSFNQDDLALARFNIDGSLDTSFGYGGKVITPLSTTNSDRANGITIQPNNKIIVSGYFESGSNRDRTAVLMAYNPDGTLDGSFGTGGQVITPIGSDYDASRVVATTGDGNIALVGQSKSSGGFTVTRYIGTSNQISPIPTNTAPTLTDTIVTLSAVNNNAGAPSGAVGTLVSSIVSLSRNVTDPNSGGLTGIAITNTNTTNGTWWYSTNNGTTWNSLGNVSSTNARLLAADTNTRVYFQPNTTFGGNIDNAITFRAWDQMGGANGGVANTTINGGSTSFSSTTDSASITVNIVAPANNNFASRIALTGNSGTTSGTNLGATAETGEPTQSGITNSVWWSWTAPTSGTYTFNTIGSNFDTFLSVYTGSSLGSLINVASNDNISVSTNTSLVSFAATAGTTYQIAVDGNQNSTGSITLNYAPSTAPTLIDTVVSLNSVDEDAIIPSGAVGTLVSSIIGIGRNVTDQGNGAATGIAIIGVNSSGALWYSTNNGSAWNRLNMGLSSSQALLLAADTNTRIYYQTYSNFNGNISNAITFRAWNQTSGVAGSFADTTINGGSSAFSSAFDIASININSVNDAPIITKGYSFSIPDNFQNGTVVGTVTATDVDNTTLSWTINNGNIDRDGDGNLAFRINSNTGQIIINDSDDLNPQINPRFNLQVNASDGFASDNESVIIALKRSAGDLDPSFGNGGVVVTDLGSTSETALSVAIQQDGKIVVLGTTYSVNAPKYALTRYNVDGSLDTTFGSNGKLVTSITHTYLNEECNVQVLPNGKILVSGTIKTGDFSDSVDFVLAQFNANGTPDNSFGNAGLVVTPIGNSEDRGTGVAIQSDGKIIVGGYTRSGFGSSNYYDFALARYNTNGSLDSSFGSSGKVITDLGGIFDTAYAVAVQADGKIVVGGYIQDSSGYDFALARYNSDGTLDSSFGSGGKVRTSTSTPEYGFTLAIQADGKIVLAGSVNNQFGLARYNSNGSLDASFGNGGIVSTKIGDDSSRIEKILIQPDGKIIATGSTSVYGSNFGSYDLAVARYNPNGSLDVSFGNSGKVVTPVSTSNDYAYGAALQANGKIVVVGEANGNFAVVRYEGNAANSVPTSINKTISLNEDTIYTFSSSDFNFTDIDTTDILQQVKITQLPILGQLFLDINNDNNQAVGEAITQNQSISVADLSKLKFKPVENGNGANYANFQFQVSDGKAFSNLAYRMTLDVAAINDAPTFLIGGNQIVNPGAGMQTVNNWASNLNPGAANEAEQSIQPYMVEVISNSNIFKVVPTITQTGDLIYTPVDTMATSTTAQIRVSVQDNGGRANGGVDTSIPQVFTITVSSATTNMVNGGAVADAIVGTDKSDRITGLAGNDTIYGGLGNDRIFGDAGNDTLYGDLLVLPAYAYGANFSMNDNIGGGSGDDLIYGNWGNDKLYGDDGNDRIWGGDGDDEIWGGLGNDILNGGTGKDTFALVRNQGVDIIEDFKLGEDVLGCAGGLRFGSLSFIQLQGDTLIRDRVNNQDIAVLKGFTGSLNNNNFLTL